MDISNSYLGFTDSMQPMKKARTENTLDKIYRYSDGVMTCKQHILNLLKAGAYGKIDPAYSYYSSKTHEMTKPKTDYQIHFVTQEQGHDIEVYNSVTKTEYDFFVYLQSQGFSDDNKVQSYLEHEAAQAEEVERQEKAQSEKKKAAQEQREAEAKAFHEWIENQIANYSNNEKLNIARQIFFDTVNCADDHQLKKLLILIENIDNSFCKDQLTEWLAYYNKASKAVFYHVTGIKLPSTDRDTFALLNSLTSTDYKGIVPYNKAVQKDTESTKKPIETFYIIDGSKQFKAVQGEAIKACGLDMFIRKVKDQYLLSESRTGVLMSNGKTRTEALNGVKAIIERNGVEQVNKILNKYIEQFGISPKFQEQQSKEVASLIS